MTQPLAADAWRPAPEFAPLSFEKVVGLGKLFSIAWLSRGLELSAPVARVVTDLAIGSGFLIAPDLLMTNHHVLPSEAQARDATADFDYQQNWAGQFEPVRRYQLDPARFLTNKALDYTIVRVQGAPGAIIGYVDLGQRAVPAVNDFVTIIQHPHGGPKEIALTDNKVSAVMATVVQYTTDTEPGSSGSPVFNQDWNIVGLHHAGGDLTGPDGHVSFTNEGILIDEIVRDCADFLGVSDTLYVLCTGDMRSTLAHIIEDGVAPADRATLAGQLLRTEASFAFTLDDWLKLHRRQGEDPVVLAAIAGTAAGAAIIRAARTDGHESIRGVAVPQPPAPEALLQALTGIDAKSMTPSVLYAAVLEKLRGSLSLIQDLLVSPGADRPNQGLVTAAGAFVLGVGIGAKAFESDRGR